MGLDLLIQKITPLFNNYKENNNQFNGTQAIELMWEVGDLLNNYIVENMIAPHSLFRTIYGNAEGTTNIVRRSYISREFQTRSHRIRRIFRQKEEINNLFPNLKKYIPFREAMPFFDDGKYKLKGKEREDLIVLLNSNLNPAKIVIEIKKLQNIYIGIKNPRTQRLHELEAEKQTFIDFYNSIFGLIKEKNYETVKLKLNGIDLEFLKILRQCQDY